MSINQSFGAAQNINLQSIQKKSPELKTATAVIDAAIQNLIQIQARVLSDDNSTLSVRGYGVFLFAD